MKVFNRGQVVALFLILSSLFLTLSFHSSKATPTAQVESAPVVQMEDVKPIVYTDNNPGHIKKGVKWVGEVTCQKPISFECFTAPEWGTRAMARLLRNYQKEYGLYTITEIVHRWAPESDGNDPEVYAEGVATILGADRFAPYDVENVYLLAQLMVAMIYFEGSYDDNTIRDVVNGVRLEHAMRKFTGYVPRTFGHLTQKEPVHDRVML